MRPSAPTAFLSSTRMSAESIAIILIHPCRLRFVLQRVLRKAGESRPDEPSLVPKLHSLRARPCILRRCFLFTHCHPAFFARCPPQTGVVRGPMGLAGSGRDRSLRFQVAALLNLQRCGLWRRLWPLSYFLDRVLGYHALPHHRGTGKIRNY